MQYAELVYRTEQKEPLKHADVDRNFRILERRIADLEAKVSALLQKIK